MLIKSTSKKNIAATAVTSMPSSPEQSKERYSSPLWQSLYKYNYSSKEIFLNEFEEQAKKQQLVNSIQNPQPNPKRSMSTANTTSTPNLKGKGSKFVSNRGQPHFSFHTFEMKGFPEQQQPLSQQNQQIDSNRESGATTSLTNHLPIGILTTSATQRNISLTAYERYLIAKDKAKNEQQYFIQQHQRLEGKTLKTTEHESERSIRKGVLDSRKPYKSNHQFRPNFSEKLIQSMAAAAAASAAATSRESPKKIHKQGSYILNNAANNNINSSSLKELLIDELIKCETQIESKSQLLPQNTYSSQQLIIKPNLETQIQQPSNRVIELSQSMTSSIQTPLNSHRKNNITTSSTSHRHLSSTKKQQGNKQQTAEFQSMSTEPKLDLTVSQQQIAKVSFSDTRTKHAGLETAAATQTISSHQNISIPNKRKSHTQSTPSQQQNADFIQFSDEFVKAPYMQTVTRSNQNSPAGITNIKGNMKIFSSHANRFVDNQGTKDIPLKHDSASVEQVRHEIPVKQSHHSILTAGFKSPPGNQQQSYQIGIARPIHTQFSQSQLLPSSVNPFQPIELFSKHLQQQSSIERQKRIQEVQESQAFDIRLIPSFTRRSNSSRLQQSQSSLIKHSILQTPKKETKFLIDQQQQQQQQQQPLSITNSESKWKLNHFIMKPISSLKQTHLNSHS